MTNGHFAVIRSLVPDRFRNIHPHPAHGFAQVLRWKLNTLGRKLDSFAPPSRAGSPPKTEFSATWIGHSSFLMGAAGTRFLVDPVFSEYCAPMPLKRLRRRAAPGLPLAEVAGVPFVLITHNHYDHLDRATVRQLLPETQFIAPKGLGRWFHTLGRQCVQELEWWETATAGPLQITCVPAQHFSSRTFWDRDRTLWCGWIVRAGGKTIYLAGDTGYCPVFREIGERFGPMDLSVIPIGAYEPRWFMQPMHVNPEEAVQIHRDVRSRLSVASHWGTFCLTDEPMDEPPRRLRQALEQAGIPEREFHVLDVGQTMAF